MKMKRFLAILLVMVFSLTATLAIAADSWVVIKDKHGACKVIKSDHKTPKTIAGPFASKDEAKKVKEKECPKGAKPNKPSKPTTSQ
jgi:hypothetical protein